MSYGNPSSPMTAIVHVAVKFFLNIENPGSTEDPFSKRFITPFLSALESDGFYEDDLHLIIIMNYTDNPWFAESGLEAERAWDYANLPRALYDHIWLGKFNDSVESGLILAEWFDACIDAHVKLGFEGRETRDSAGKQFPHFESKLKRVESREERQGE